MCWGRLKLTAEGEDLLILERGDVRKGRIHVIEIVGVKVRDSCAVEALVVQEHLPHLVDGVGCIDGCGAFQLADLQSNANTYAPQWLNCLTSATGPQYFLSKMPEHVQSEGTSTMNWCDLVSASAKWGPHKHWQSSEMQWVGMSQQDSVQVPRHVFKRAQQLL